MCPYHLIMKINVSKLQLIFILFIIKVNVYFDDLLVANNQAPIQGDLNGFLNVYILKTKTDHHPK